MATALQGLWGLRLRPGYFGVFPLLVDGFVRLVSFEFRTFGNLVTLIRTLSPTSKDFEFGNWFIDRCERFEKFMRPSLGFQDIQ
jgi:hypothetical protein